MPEKDVSSLHAAINPVYPGHGITVAYFIVHVFSLPDEAFGPAQLFGCSRAVASLYVPGAGCGACAGVDVLHRLWNGDDWDEVMADADDNWRRRNLNPTRLKRGQDQADSLRKQLKEHQSWWRAHRGVDAVFHQGYWTRRDVENDPDRVYLFGDNLTDAKVHHAPRATQAVIRGLANAVGIPTKRSRRTSPSAFFNDRYWNVAFKDEVDRVLLVAEEKARERSGVIVLPADGIGTGKAMLLQKAPGLFNYLRWRLRKLPSVPENYMEG